MNYFVFVVCGAREHIDTLNFSIKLLLRFSKFPIRVVTDSTRNEAPIHHSDIIDIKTPAHFDHHQASIFLKTGLHKVLPDLTNNTYCYLDTDIVAISEACNQIFDFQPRPILFASDHCNISEFSPYAINCSCAGDFQLKAREFEQAMDHYFPGYNPADSEVIKSQKRLNVAFDEMKRHFFGNFSNNISYLYHRYASAKKKFFLNDEFWFDKEKRVWFDQKNRMINFDYHYHRSKLFQQCGIEFKNNRWMNRKGENITPQTPFCPHLTDYLDQKYGVRIPGHWQHWNGGVFLFNHDSVDFLDHWHKSTIEEFSNPYTKTRDQGTLAMTTWKFQLQEMETLPVKFNFITEFNNPNIAWSKDKGFTNDGFASTFEPCLLHIYHEWGHEGWSIWDYVAALAAKKTQQD